MVVTAAANWHPGVVGLLAARLKERFNRPAFAIALEPGGTGTGSGRSILGVDLGKTVRRAVTEGLLLKGGGHAMAAGITVKHGALAEFRAYLESELAEGVTAARADQALLIDGAVSAAGANAALVETIARAGPFGAGNPEPVVALPNHVVAYADPVGQAHVRVAAAFGRRHDAQRHRVPRRRPAARPGADEEPRPGAACRRHAVDRPLERRRAGAVAADRCGVAFRGVTSVRSIGHTPRPNHTRNLERPMSKLNLSVAIGDYDRNRPLIDGAVQIDGVDPVFMKLYPEEIFFRAFRSEEFDICECSLSSFSVKTAAGNCPYVGVPAFVSRMFRHTSMSMPHRPHQAAAGLEGQEDRRAGVSAHGQRLGARDAGR